MKLRPISAAILLALSGLTLAVQAADVRRPYVVQLTDKPIASYDGAVKGLSATQPRPGQRLDLDSASVQLYSGYLAQKKAAVRAAIGNAPVVHDYKVVLNGFSAMLTDAEVRALVGRSDVLAVTPDVPRELTTLSTRDFLKLDGPNGAWSQLGTRLKAGEDVIIGIVDGGVWPEHLSYADRVDANGKPTHDDSGSLAYTAPPARWQGECQTGEGFTTAHCNNKLIGAQYFDDIYLSVGRETHWSEFRSSPRDSLGGDIGEGSHGTHTSTTAGGNYGVGVTMNGVEVGEMSGVAPRARIASYKVCWTYVDTTVTIGRRNSCYVGDSVAAIEKAVSDGVHVINFSISGGTSLNDPVEQAFFGASNAGVIGVASAGNDGPGNQVAHISPWHTTVGASTHNREFQSTVTLGNSQRYTGASMNTEPLPAAPLVDASTVGLPGVNAARLAFCYSASFNGGAALLDPAKVKGKVVICNRGENDRVDKSRAVKEAGGVGMIQVDNGTGLVADMHSVPSVHVTQQDGQAIRTYAATGAANASAAISKFVVGVSRVAAPVMAGFSSRGPNRADPNVLKPDVTAPGVDIIAGGTPGLSPEDHANIVNGTMVPPVEFVSMQGTSMSAPHVAGLSALLRQKYPTWSPAMIKSALMTTATDTIPDNLTGDIRGHLPFAQGAGHVDPTASLDPGLVYDIGEADYRKYLCGTGMSTQCAGGQMAGYDLNLPSIAVGNVLGTVTINRSVTNVSADVTSFRSEISVPGYDAVVSPATLSIEPGQTKPFTVTLTRNGAPENAWQYGSLTWYGGEYAVRSPIVARSGRSIVAPTAFASDRPSGSKAMGISTGVGGKISAVTGLKSIARTAQTISPAPGGAIDTLAQMLDACVKGNHGARLQPVTFTADTLAAQFELFDRDTAGQGNDDLDLLLINAANQLVAYSATPGSDETIALLAPPAGSYRLCTLGYSTASGGATSYGLHSAVANVGDKDGTLRALVPAKVYAGGKATVAVTWSGLPTGKRFLGGVRLLDAAGSVGSTTVVQIETNQPIPKAERPQRVKAQDPRI